MHGAVVSLPEHEHDEVLGVGQAQRREQRLVQLGHRQRTGVQGETQLLVETQQLVGA